MLGCEFGDHVQSVNRAPSSSSTRNEGDDDDSHFHIHRVNLHGPPYHHDDNWLHTVLPRVRCFHSLLLQLRRDDCARYRWLLSEDVDKLALLQERCTHFDLRERMVKARQLRQELELQQLQQQATILL